MNEAPHQNNVLQLPHTRLSPETLRNRVRQGGPPKCRGRHRAWCRGRRGRGNRIHLEVSIPVGEGAAGAFRAGPRLKNA